MSRTEQPPPTRFKLICLRCDRPMLARSEWIGREVQCPHCASVLRVPPPPPDGRPVTAQEPSRSPRRRFNFTCPRCGCVLEAHTGMSGSRGTCPTCAAVFSVPYVNPDTGEPDPISSFETETDERAPLHAYAASGHQAPILHRGVDGEMQIECPRCQARSPIEADACVRCGAPFTLEGAATAAKIERDNWASASLILGVISLPTFFLWLPAVLAVAFGLRSILTALHSGGVQTIAIVGVALGSISLLGAAARLLL